MDVDGESSVVDDSWSLVKWSKPNKIGWEIIALVVIPFAGGDSNAWEPDGEDSIMGGLSWMYVWREMKYCEKSDISFESNEGGIDGVEGYESNCLEIAAAVEKCRFWNLENRLVEAVS
jgi:hypothetical protein